MKNWLLIILLASIVQQGCKNDKPEATVSVNQAQQQMVQDLTRQVRLHPDSSPVRMRLINALDSLGSYPEALTHIDTLIMRDSANNGLWYAKAQLQESNKDTTEAISSYEKALLIYPSVDAQLSLANLLAEKKDKRSLDICQSINKMGLDREVNASCDFIAGIYYARTGQSARAIQFFDRCINNNYTYMEAYMEKGFINFDQKKYNEALQVFDKAITVNNMYADAYYWKAKTFEAMGNKQEAIINYQRSLGLDKGMKEAREALDKLK